MKSLSAEDIELGRRYIVIRSAIKALTHDKQKFREEHFQLSAIYVNFIEHALVKANDELRLLNKYLIQAKPTDQPTVYEIKLGPRIGYVEVNVVEITEEIARLFEN